MDFDLSEEQRLLKDSVDRLMLDQYQFEQRKKYMREPAGYSGAMWDQITEMGLLGLPFEETLGGFGGGAVETAIVMEAFGRGLVLEPFLRHRDPGRRTSCAGRRRPRSLAGLAPKVASGKLKLAFAHVERHSRYNLADVSTTARKDGGGYLLDGAKSVVIHGDAADRIFVTARIGGERRTRTALGCS